MDDLKRYKWALVDEHGELLGYYHDRAEAEKDKTMLDEGDLGIVEVTKSPTLKEWRHAGLRMLSRLGQKFEGGYR